MAKPDKKTVALVATAVLTVAIAAIIVHAFALPAAQRSSAEKMIGEGDLEGVVNLLKDADSAEREQVLSAISSTEDLDSIISLDVSLTTESLTKDAIELSTSIEHYDQQSSDAIEALYGRAVDDTNKLCDRAYAYALRYGEIIAGSNASGEEKAEMCRSFRASLYDGAGSDMERAICDDTFVEIEDRFLRSAVRAASRADLVEERSRWEEAKSETYGIISATRDNIFLFYDEIRLCVQRGDDNGLDEAIGEFRNSLEGRR